VDSVARFGRKKDKGECRKSCKRVGKLNINKQMTRLKKMKPKLKSLSTQVLILKTNKE